MIGLILATGIYFLDAYCGGALVGDTAMIDVYMTFGSGTTLYAGALEGTTTQIIANKFKNMFSRFTSIFPRSRVRVTVNNTTESSNNSARSGVNENNSATRNSGATKSKVYNPLTKKGPLGSPNDPGSIASTFRSGTYTKTVAGENMTLYRVTSKGGNPTGSYWTRTKPNGPVQSIIDSALDQKWGNSATQVHQMTLPKGTTFFEGVAAQQRGLVGGGNQIYIPKVKPSWIAK